MNGWDTLEALLTLNPSDAAMVVRAMGEDRVLDAVGHWPGWAQPGQLAPAGDWRTWVLMAGRGFGKTRAGAEWVLGVVRGAGAGAASFAAAEGPLLKGEVASRSDDGGVSPYREGDTPPPRASRAVPLPFQGRIREELRIALVAGTVDEARRVMVEGPSGILACAREGEIEDWCPSRRELRFAGGAVATLFSGANPEALRGPQHHLAWCDELAKWRRAQGTWDMLQLGLRCGERPRALVTTTPRGGCAALKRILAAADTMLTGGKSGDNPHLPAAFLRSIESAYGGTRMGREEIDGVFVDDVAGTLWPAALIERSRGAAPAAERLVRVVAGVDPPASAEGTCGIIVCGLDADGVGHVLADHSAGGLSPEGWARKVLAAAEAHGADRVIAESNQGGDMVRSVLRAAGIVLPITPATASRSKAARAEPVAGLFESGKARLAGHFPELEAELGRMVPEGYAGAGVTAGAGPGGRRRSPDRADAMVWALWALLIAPRAEPRVRAL